jgi:hypothetical protein
LASLKPSIIALILAAVLIPIFAGLPGLASQRQISALATDQQQVIQQTVAAVKGMMNPAATETTQVTQIAIVGTYSLTTWTFGQSGGNAALSYNKRTGWTVIRAHGSQMDATILTALGVPSTTATQLVANLAPVPTPAPTATPSPTATP